MLSLPRLARAIVSSRGLLILGLGLFLISLMLSMVAGGLALAALDQASAVGDDAAIVAAVPDLMGTAYLAAGCFAASLAAVLGSVIRAGILVTRHVMQGTAS